MKTKYSLQATPTQTIRYGYNPSFRKWTFVHGTDQFLCACHGNEQGHKVANIIAGSIKRVGKIDGLARANISSLTTPKNEVE